MLRRLYRLLFGAKGKNAEFAGLLTEASELLAQGRVDAALAKVEIVAVDDPGNVLALRMKAQALSALGRLPEALLAFRRALQRDRKDSNLRVLYGNALRLAGDADGAEVEYRQAMGASPNCTAAYMALGCLLLDTRRPAEAETVLRSASQMAPNDEEIQRKLALAAFRVFDFTQARDIYLPLHRGGRLDIHERNCLGICFLNTGKLELAREVFAAALADAPEGAAANPLIARNLAYCHLTAGDWSEGFRLHERRFQAAKASRETVDAPETVDWLDFIDTALTDIPAWTDGGCEGKRLLVWVEQGLGDVIMLLRLVPVLQEDWRAAEVTLLCPASRAAIAAGCEGVRPLAVTPEWRPPPSRYDAHCSIMSLPYLMRIEPHRIPGAVPYIRVSVSQRRPWQDRTASLRGMRVGLAWAGNTQLPLDTLRSISLQALAPLLFVDGVTFVSLQKDEAARSELRSYAPDMIDWMDECGDLMATAALIDSLDLVISVDTAVAHLAGAMGKPIWLLNRYESEWRWLRGREDSVWYPTMRIFSQTAPRDWGPVIERMARELSALVAVRSDAPANPTVSEAGRC